MAVELVGIELELRGADGVQRDLDRLDSTLDKLRGRKQLKLGLQEAQKEALKARGEIEKLKREIQDADEGADLDNLQSQLQEAKRRLQDCQQATRELQYALKNLAGATFWQRFKRISTSIKHAGQNLQTLGNALTRASSPFRNIMQGTFMGVGYKMIGKVTEGLDSAFERADIMTKYARNLEVNFGKSADEADRLKGMLNDAVEGLPTGLDEIVNMANKFTASIGDAERGAKLAIATNNAFLASQTDEVGRYQGMLQLRDVIGGKNMNAREWQSLAQSMLPAIRMIGEELGYTGQELNDYVQRVQSGKVANEEFLDALIKYGTEGKIRETAELAMDTWESFFSRIRTQTANLGYNAILKLNDIVKKATNGEFESLNSFLDNRLIENGIKKISGALQEWLGSEEGYKTITDFAKAIGDVDWMGIAKNFANGVLSIANILKWFASTGAGKWGLEHYFKWLPYLSILGRFFTITGGLGKGLSHPFGAIGAGIWTLLDKKGGIFKKIASFFGKKKDLDTAKDVAETAVDTAPVVSKASGSLISMFKNVSLVAGSVAVVSGAGFISFKAVKSMLSDLKEIGDILKDMTWIDATTGAGIVLGIGVMVKVFEALGTALGTKGLLAVAIAGVASSIVAGTFTADMWLIKMGVIQIRDTITELGNVVDQIANFQGIGTLGEDVKQKFKDSINAINEIKGLFEGKSGSKMDRGVVELGLPTFSISKVGALTNIANAIEQLQNIASQLNALSTVTVSDPSAVIGDIKTACSSLQGIRAPKGLAKHSEALAESLYQIRRMAYHINKLAGTEVNTGGFATFVQNIKSALAELKGVNGEMVLDVEVKLSPLFGSSVQGVIKNIKDAKSSIEKLNKAINVTIPVNVKFSVTSNAFSAIAKINRDRQVVESYRPKGGRATPLTSQNGGAVYRANGGSVFKPRGTDRIPAMLTQGEFVQKKKAVDYFGLDFMRKVNNLDIRGAMQSLMMRGGANASIGRQSTINNTVNNNQRVTQNINTNNPQFAKMRMGRFAGAL